MRRSTTILTMIIAGPAVTTVFPGWVEAKRGASTAKVFDNVIRKVERMAAGRWTTTGPKVRMFDRQGRMTAQSLPNNVIEKTIRYRKTVDYLRHWEERVYWGKSLRSTMTVAAMGKKSLFGRNIPWFGASDYSAMVGRQRWQGTTPSGDVITRVRWQLAEPKRGVEKRRIIRREVLANEKVGTKISVNGIDLVVTRQQETLPKGTVELRRISHRTTKAWDQVFETGAQFREYHTIKVHSKYTK